MTKTILITSLTAAVLLVTIIGFSDQLQEQWASAIGSSGLDGVSSEATVVVTLFNAAPLPDGTTTDLTLAVTVQGPTVIKKMHPPGSVRTIQTEILSMSLTGVDPIQVTLLTIKAGSFFGLPPSTGEITPQSQDRDFPADSFFDVFFEIEVTTEPGREPKCLTNVDLRDPENKENALRMEAVINQIPPVGTFYQSQRDAPLFPCNDPDSPPVGVVTHAFHLIGTNTDLKVEIKKELINPITERDNITISEIKLISPQKLVLVDNAGSGGTSDVEVTWRFDPQTCVVQWLPFGANPAIAGNWMAFANDGAFGLFAAHADAAPVEAVALSAVDGATCKLVPRSGHFVTVSTVGSS